METCLLNLWATGYLGFVGVQCVTAYEHHEELAPRALTQPGDLSLIETKSVVAHVLYSLM